MYGKHFNYKNVQLRELQYIHTFKNVLNCFGYFYVDGCTCIGIYVSEQDTVKTQCLTVVKLSNHAVHPCLTNDQYRTFNYLTVIQKRMRIHQGIQTKITRSILTPDLRILTKVSVVLTISKQPYIGHIKFLHFYLQYILYLRT